MIEKVFKFAKETQEKNVEKIINDGIAMVNHFVLPKGEGLPKHYSNSNVYMIVVQGELSIDLDHQGVHIYEAGTILAIPYNVHMDVNNQTSDLLEMFVIKAPSPENYKEV